MNKDLVGGGRVLADSDGQVIRLWVEGIRDSLTRRAIRRFFPEAKFGQAITRLGGYGSLTQAIANLEEARIRSASTFIQNLHLYEENDSEGLQ